MSERYTTKDALKRNLTTKDGESLEATLDKALAAASDMVDHYCHRRFDRTAAEARQFALDIETAVVWTDDIAALPTTVEIRTTNTDVWTALQAAEWSTRQPQQGHPYSALLRIGGRWPAELFPTVRVTAEFGWPAVPPSIEQATRLLAARYVVRPKDALLMAATAKGEMLRYDPDVKHLLRPFVRSWS